MPMLEPIVIEEARKYDSRGSFIELFRQDDFKASSGFNFDVVQINRSYSKKNVIRGIHFQRFTPQTKLCFVAHGSVLDVVIDLRKSSPHFKKVYSVILSPKQGNQILIPKGFGHGFLSLEKDSEFFYLQDKYYDPGDQYGINPMDPAFSKYFNVQGAVISEKDLALPFLDDLPQDLFFD